MKRTIRENSKRRRQAQRVQSQEGEAKPSIRSALEKIEAGLREIRQVFDELSLITPINYGDKIVDLAGKE